MNEIPVISGIYVKNNDYRTSYPINRHYIPLKSGLSEGYLRFTDGIEKKADGQGLDRGGISWNGVHYRVSGSKLITIDEYGYTAIIGDVGVDSIPAKFDYSFDRLAILSAGKLFYYDLGSLTQVTDPDLGYPIDLIWQNGYFVLTDGTFIYVTDLSDPMSINNLKYGASEASPDPIVGLTKIKNEIYAVNRYTIEAFSNVGSEYFPFERVQGAQLERGAVGTNAFCIFMDQIAYLGSRINEGLSIWLNSTKISTREIDIILKDYSETELTFTKLETRIDSDNAFLYIHLNDKTLVYDGIASQKAQAPIWSILQSGLGDTARYNINNFVYVYNKWWGGDPASTNIGVLNNSITTHFGNKIKWQFDTIFIYNESKDVILHEVEIPAITGGVAVGTNPSVGLSYSQNGEEYSQVRYTSCGVIGNRQKRIAWRRLGRINGRRVLRFTGDSDSSITIAKLLINAEALNA